MDKLHSQLLNSRGKLLVELVESLCGKPVPSKVGKLSSNKKDAAMQLHGMFDSILGVQFVLKSCPHLCWAMSMELAQAAHGLELAWAEGGCMPYAQSFLWRT